MNTIYELCSAFPDSGRLQWIGLRTAKNKNMLAVKEAQLDSENGLLGDHYRGVSGKRQVTLFQQEHLAVIAALTGQAVSAGLLRRNLVIAGINLLALKNHPFKLGEAVLLATGLCHPCSQMEKALGTGGYNAMRGHGGITARVLKSGMIKLGDKVIAFPGK